MINVETVAETGSTNADLLARLGAGETIADGYWLRAERQRGGRGRLGRKWESPIGNLFCSTVVNLRPDDDQPHTLSFVTALAVHDALTTHLPTSAELFLKWPNDTLIGGAKIAGILLERAGNSVVVGIGANVAQAPEVPGRKTTSIAAERDDGTVDAQTVLDSLAAAFQTRLTRWRSEGITATLDAWTQRAHPLGSKLSLSPGDEEPITGEFAGLDTSGALLLRLANGAMRTIHAGDVSMISEG